MKSFAVCVLLSLAIGGAYSQSCHLRELDLCAATAAGNNKIATSDAEIDKHCAVLDETKQCFSNFTTRCTTPIQRELLALVGEGANEVAKKFCTKGDKLRSDYLKHAPCLVKSQPQGKKCLNDVQTGLERIEEAKFQDRISTGCCVYTRYNKCSTEAIETTCGKEAVEFGSVLLKLATANLLEVVCKGYETDPVCNTLLPPPGTKAKGNSKSVISKLFNAYVQS